MSRRVYAHTPLSASFVGGGISVRSAGSIQPTRSPLPSMPRILQPVRRVDSEISYGSLTTDSDSGVPAQFGSSATSFGTHSLTSPHSPFPPGTLSQNITALGLETLQGQEALLSPSAPGEDGRRSSAGDAVQLSGRMKSIPRRARDSDLDSVLGSVDDGCVHTDLPIAYTADREMRKASFSHKMKDMNRSASEKELTRDHSASFNDQSERHMQRPKSFVHRFKRFLSRTPSSLCVPMDGCWSPCSLCVCCLCLCLCVRVWVWVWVCACASINSRSTCGVHHSYEPRAAAPPMLTPAPEVRLPPLPLLPPSVVKKMPARILYCKYLPLDKCPPTEYAMRVLSCSLSCEPLVLTW